MNEDKEFEFKKDLVKTKNPTVGDYNPGNTSLYDWAKEFRVGGDSFVRKHN